MDAIAQLKLSLRALVRSPLFSLGVLTTLALSLAASIATVTLVDRVLWRPLPLRDPASVVVIMEADSASRLRLASYPTFDDWRSQAKAFDGMAFIRGETMSLGPEGARQRVTAALVSEGYFAVGGITPVLGRTFSSAEESLSGGGVLVLSEAVWSSQFGRAADVIGKAVIIDGESRTVIGVIPTAQRLFGWEEIWVPLAAERSRTPEVENRFLHVDSRVLARLSTGTTVEGASSDLLRIQQNLAAQFPDPAGTYANVQMTPIRDVLIGNVSPTLSALGWAMLLVLLLACANVAGLVLLRTARRQRELSVRTALGAPFSRLVGQLVSETVLLSLIAGAVGVMLATVVIGVVRATPSIGIPRASELYVDGRTLWIALGISLVVGLAVGLLPAWRLRGTLEQSARFARGAAADGAGMRRLRASATALQLGLALTLLVGAGLLLRSFNSAQQVDLGYRTEQIVAMDVYPPSPRFDAESDAASLYRQLVDRAAAIPGVQNAAFINHTPLGGWMPTVVSAPGVSPATNGSDAALYKTASEEYADVVGLRIVKGRWFTRAEVDAGAPGVVISEAVATRFWPDGDAIGRAITVHRSSQARPGFGDPQPSTVIGVVAPVRHFGPTADAPWEVYLPFTRQAWAWGSVVVRSNLPPAVLRRNLESAMREVEPDMPMGAATGAGYRTFAEGVEGFIAPRRVATILGAGLAAVALLIASLGLYALSAYSVSQRTSEFGVRMALGAAPGAIIRDVLRDGGRLALVGIALGLAGAVGMGRVLASQLFGVAPTDPMAFTAAAALLIAVLMFALWFPARRASRLDPVTALREE